MLGALSCGKHPIDMFSIDTMDTALFALISCAAKQALIFVS